MADHALLRSQTAVGMKQFPLLLVLCVTDLHQRPRASVQTPHTGHAESPLKQIPLCAKSLGHRTRTKSQGVDR